LDLAKIRKKARGGDPAPKPGKRSGRPSEGADPESPQPEAAAETPRTPEESEATLPEEPRAPAVEAPPEPAAQPSPSAAAGEPAADAFGATGEKLLIFDLASEKYAIPIHDIAQIIDLPPVTPVPNAPVFLAGIFSLRGRIVSVIDVARRLGLEGMDHEAPKVVVLDLGADHFGLLVDRIDQVVDVNLSSLEPPPEGFKPLAQEFVEGVFHHRERAVAFLNLPMFLTFEV
jgi:purine-binding chemotaxis protein CheW